MVTIDAWPSDDEMCEPCGCGHPLGQHHYGDVHAQCEHCSCTDFHPPSACTFRREAGRPCYYQHPELVTGCTCACAGCVAGIHDECTAASADPVTAVVNAMLPHLEHLVGVDARGGSTSGIVALLTAVAAAARDHLILATGEWDALCTHLADSNLNRLPPALAARITATLSGRTAPRALTHPMTTPTEPLRTRVLIEAHCADQARAIRDRYEFNLRNGYAQVEHADQPTRDAYSEMKAWANLADTGVDDYGSDNRARRWSVAVLAARLRDNANCAPRSYDGQFATMNRDIDAGRRRVHIALADALRPTAVTG